MEFIRCPKCGRYMIPYLVMKDTARYRCICGKDAKKKISYKK